MHRLPGVCVLTMIRKGMMKMTEQEMMELFAGRLTAVEVAFVSAADRLGIEREEALKLSSAFGGGMYAGETCGAVTGSLMAIGYKYGHCKPGDAAAKEKVIRESRGNSARLSVNSWGRRCAVICWDTT